MKLSSYILSISTALMLLTACKKAEELRYQEDPRIYFSKFVVNADSTIYSFAVQPATKTFDTVRMTMRIMGSAVDHDREINLQVDDSSTGKRGYHFDLGPLVMPANAYQTTIPVILYRKQGLQDSMVNIYFTVVESKDFKPGFDDKPGTTYKKTRLQYKVSFNDYLVKPSRWDASLASYLGDYSETKFRFIIQYTAKTTWESALDTTPGIMNFVVTTVKNALREYELANGPLLDENGNRVTFP